MVAVKCPGCGTQRDVEWEAGESKLYCIACDREYYACPECGSHKIVHNEDNELECRLCGMSFGVPSLEGPTPLTSQDIEWLCRLGDELSRSLGGSLLPSRSAAAKRLGRAMTPERYVREHLRHYLVISRVLKLRDEILRGGATPGLDVLTERQILAETARFSQMVQLIDSDPVDGRRKVLQGVRGVLQAEALSIEAARESKEPFIRHLNDAWEICFKGKVTRYKGSYLGFRILKVMLTQPYKEFKVPSELGAVVPFGKLKKQQSVTPKTNSAGLPIQSAFAGYGLDDRARSEYRAELRRLSREREQMVNSNDLAGLARVDRAYQEIERQLQEDRYSRKKRVEGEAGLQDALRKNLAKVLGLIQDKHPELAEHLRGAGISPVRFPFAYRPAKRLNWGE